MLLLFNEPFTPGDMITFKAANMDITGRVERIGWGQIRLRGNHTRPTYIPNSHFVQTPVTNMDRITHRKFETIIPIRFQDYYLVPDITNRIKESLKLIPKLDILSMPFRVSMVELGKYSLNIEILCYFATKSVDEFLGFQQQAYIEVLKATEASGAQLALAPILEQINLGHTSVNLSPITSPKSDSVDIYRREASRQSSTSSDYTTALAPIAINSSNTTLQSGGGSLHAANNGVTNHTAGTTSFSTSSSAINTPVHANTTLTSLAPFFNSTIHASSILTNSGPTFNPSLNANSASTTPISPTGTAIHVNSIPTLMQLPFNSPIHDDSAIASSILGASSPLITTADAIQPPATAKNAAAPFSTAPVTSTPIESLPSIKPSSFAAQVPHTAVSMAAGSSPTLVEATIQQTSILQTTLTQSWQPSINTNTTSQLAGLPPQIILPSGISSFDVAETNSMIFQSLPDLALRSNIDIHNSPEHVEPSSHIVDPSMNTSKYTSNMTAAVNNTVTKSIASISTQPKIINETLSVQTLHTPYRIQREQNQTIPRSFSPTERSFHFSANKDLLELPQPVTAFRNGSENIELATESVNTSGRLPIVISHSNLSENNTSVTSTRTDAELKNSNLSFYNRLETEITGADAS